MPVTLKHKRVTLLIVTSLLVLIAGGRILRLNLAHKELHIDEVWSIWQLIGNQTDYTRDATWPPLYYMSLDGWRRLVGIDPISLRYLSVLVFMIGAACTYRLIRRFGNQSAALIGMLAYSAMAVLRNAHLLFREPLSNGAFPVYLTVYQWWDNTRIDAPGMNQDKLLPIETLYIKGW